MPPAIIAAGVAAVGTIGGALIGSHSQSSAANQANQAEQGATAAQLQLGQQSLALQNQLAQQSMGLNQSIYNSNYDLLSPFVSRGNVAGDSINALLGLPSAPVMRSPMETSSGGLAPIQLPPSPTGGGTPLPGTGGTPTPGSSIYSGPSLAQILTMQHDGIPGNYAAAMAAYNAAHQPSYSAPSLPAPSAPAPYSAPVVSQTPVNALAPQAPAAPANTLALQQHAQEAIAAGADPSAVNARLGQMTGMQRY